MCLHLFYLDIFTKILWKRGKYKSIYRSKLAGETNLCSVEPPLVCECRGTSLAAALARARSENKENNTLVLNLF